jgi:hypothetical protein
MLRVMMLPPKPLRRPLRRNVRPVFVWALAVIVVPLVLIFGIAMVVETSGPWRVAAVPAVAFGLVVAPAVLGVRGWRHRWRLGTAITAGLALASAVLIVDLFGVAASEGDAFAVAWVCLVAVAAGVLVRADAMYRPLAPPRPDFRTPPTRV